VGIGRGKLLRGRGGEMQKLLFRVFLGLVFIHQVKKNLPSFLVSTPNQKKEAKALSCKRKSTSPETNPVKKYKEYIQENDCPFPKER